MRDRLISAPASILAPSDVDIPPPERHASAAAAAHSRYPARKRTIIAFAGCRRYPDSTAPIHFFPNSSVKIAVWMISVAFCQEMHRIVNAIDYVCLRYVKQHVFL
jgi:hypothetical protein